MSDYAEREKFWCEMKGIKDGSKVTITGKASRDEDGWCNGWAKDMDSFVGKTGVVYAFSSCDNGIRVRIEGCLWWYPYWVVEPVKE